MADGSSTAPHAHNTAAQDNGHPQGRDYEKLSGRIAAETLP